MENIKIEQTIGIEKTIEILADSEKKGNMKFLKNGEFFVREFGVMIFRNFICVIDQYEDGAVFSVAKNGSIFFYVK